MLASAGIAYAELRAALAAAHRDRHLSRLRLAEAQRELEKVWAAISPLPSIGDLIRQAGDLAESQRLGGSDASHAAFLSAGAAPHPQPGTSTDESAQSRTLDQAMTIGGAGTTAWPTWSPQSHAPCSENHRQAGAACFGSCWVEASPSARQPRGFASPDAPGPGGSSRPCRRGAEVQNVGLDPRPSGDPHGQIHGPGDLR